MHSFTTRFPKEQSVSPEGIQPADAKVSATSSRFMNHIEAPTLKNLRLMESSKVKAVRFSQLVESSGKPEVVTLWADPKKDQSFMRLVKKRRVVTIVQKPAGTRKDFGYVGFHPQPFAVFLVFPKALKPDEGLQIIGIKYDLLKSPSPQKGFPPKIVNVPRTAAKKPPENSFNVRILRILSQELDLEVKGQNMTEAKAKAIVAALEQSLPPRTTKISDKVIEIRYSTPRNQ
jgi:hypothetical protein